MKIATLFASILATCFCLAASNLPAGVFTSVTGTAAPGSSNSLSPAYFAVGATLDEPTLRYYDNLPLDYTATVDGPGEYEVAAVPSFGLVNNFGSTTWTGFNMDLVSASSPGFAFTYAFDYTGLAPTITNGGTSVDFVGAVPGGSFMKPDIKFTVTQAGTYTFRETPVTPAPEPATWLLFASGAVGLLAFRRKVSANTSSAA